VGTGLWRLLPPSPPPPAPEGPQLHLKTDSSKPVSCRKGTLGQASASSTFSNPQALVPEVSSLRAKRLFFGQHKDSCPRAAAASVSLVPGQGRESHSPTEAELLQVQALHTKTTKLGSSWLSALVHKLRPLRSDHAQLSPKHGTRGRGSTSLAALA